MPDAKAIGYLELNIAGFEQAITSAKRLLGGLATAFVSFKTAEFFKDGIKGAIEFGNQMYFAGQKLGGFDPGKLLIAQKALENAGLGADEARSKINEFLDSGRNLADIFKGSDNYAAALQNAAKSYGSQAGILSASSEKLSKVFEIMQSVGSKVHTFFLSLTSQFVKPLQVVLEELNRIDLAGIGETFGRKIGDAITMIVGLFKSGTLFDLIKTGLKLAFEEGINFFVSGALQAVDFIKNGLGQAFYKAVEFLQEIITKVFSSGIWSVLLNTFTALGTKIVSILLNAFETPIRYLKAGLQVALEGLMQSLGAIPGVNKVLGLEGFESSSFQDALSQQGEASVFGNTAEDYSKASDRAFDNVVNPISDAITETLKEFQAQGIDADKIFKTDELQKKFSAIVENASKLGGKLTSGLDSTKIKINQQALDKQEPYRVISDSLSKVGGGGNFIRVGQNLLEREAVKQTHAQEQMLKQMEALNKNISNAKTTVIRRE